MMKVLSIFAAVPKKWWLYLALAAGAAAIVSWQIDTIQRAAVNAWQGEQLREELRDAEQELQREREESARLERLARERAVQRDRVTEDAQRLRSELRELEETHEEVARWSRERIPGPVLERLRNEAGAGDADGD